MPREGVVEVIFRVVGDRRGSTGDSRVRHHDVQPSELRDRGIDGRLDLRGIRDIGHWPRRRAVPPDAIERSRGRLQVRL
jgi:hypothetical protein